MLGLRISRELRVRVNQLTRVYVEMSVKMVCVGAVCSTSGSSVHGMKMFMFRWMRKLMRLLPSLA